MEAMTAERLAGMAAAGDERAFGELVRASSRTLYAAARAILQSDQDAQDCVQEAVWLAWRKLPTLRDRARFTTWITRITINAAINMTRRRKPSAPLRVDLPAPGERSDEQCTNRRAKPPPGQTHE